MNSILEYKGYWARVDFDSESMVLHGKIEGIKDLVTFESSNAEAMEREFHSAVDEYLAFCEEIGKVPDKAYKGSFNVRIDPSLHRKLAMQAEKNGITLNAAVEQAIRESLNPKPGPDEMLKQLLHDFVATVPLQNTSRYAGHNRNVINMSEWKQQDQKGRVAK